MRLTDKLTADEETALAHAVVRLNQRTWGLAMGVVGGLVLFLATSVLVARGGSLVGPHLGLLGLYLPGYRVTWGGAFIGLMYGAILGYAFGWLIGAVYNRLVSGRA